MVFESFLTPSSNSAGIISPNRRRRGRFDRLLVVNFYKTESVFCTIVYVKFHQQSSTAVALFDSFVAGFVFQRRVKPSDMVLLTSWILRRNRRKEP